MSVKEKTSFEDHKNNTDDSKLFKYTNEQRIVSAVWMHEKQFNNQSIEDVKNNFTVRFKLPPPDTKTLIMWENNLFSKEDLKKNESGAEDNSEDQFSDVQTSDEEESD